MTIRNIIAPALLVVLAGVLIVQLPRAIADRSDGYAFIDPIIDVRRILLDDFVRPPDEQQMRDAAIKAMVESVDDPYTEYITTEQRVNFQKDLRGRYVGIGAEVNIVNDYLTIVTPMADSPALEAGIRAGDVVLEIEGESTFKMPVETAIERLLGVPGTTVELRVRHLDDTEEVLEVERRQIVTRTVRGIRRDGEAWIHCVDDDLGLHYLRITQFNETTVEEVAAALEQLQDGGVNGLILDLRDNPGGALPAAVDVADLFLESGTIVSIQGRDQQQHRTFQAQAPGTLPNFPLVVLVNNRSASASEIVAGALKENNRAVVLGNRTFGKGSVQEVRDLPFDRGTLKFTSAHYHLASGRNIHRVPDSDIWGVDPTPGMVVTVPDEAYFEMIERRREFEVISEPEKAGNGPHCVTAEWIDEAIGDVQLSAAVQALQSHVRGEGWPSVGDEEPHLVAMTQQLDSLLEQRQWLLEQLDDNQSRLQSMQEFAVSAGREPLVPADAELTGGTIIVRDQNGNVIGEYRIGTDNVDLALEMAEATRLQTDVDEIDESSNDEE